MNTYEESKLESKKQQDYAKNIQREQRRDPAKKIYNPLYSAIDKDKSSVENEPVNPERNSEALRQEEQNVLDQQEPEQPEEAKQRSKNETGKQ